MKESYLIICIEFECNNECINCMLEGYKDKLIKINLDEYKKILKEKLKNDKYDGLILSGAEVTLNEELLEYVKYSKSFKNLKHIRIQTNGRKLSDYEYCKKLVDAGVDEFFITINADNAELHDTMTKKEGSFEETLKGITNLELLNTTTITNTVITNNNYQRLKKIVELISQFKNIKSMHFWNYWPTNEKDDKDLIPKLEFVRLELINAINECIRNEIRPQIKNFPNCLLEEYQTYIDNSQPDIIIDKKFWKEYDKNAWNCLFIKQCSHALKKDGCNGISLAYIKKFGWEEKLLTPKIEKCPNPKEKYEFYTKKFNLEDNEQMILFEKLLQKSENMYLECSHKICKENIYSSRLNIWYKNELTLNMINIIEFLNRIQKTKNSSLNYELLPRFIPKINIDDLKDIILGIDYRKKIEESRIKLWFVTQKPPKQIIEIIEKSKNAELYQLLHHNNTLFGFDFYFNGKNRIKIYPLLIERDLKNEKIQNKLEKIFDKKIIEMIKETQMTHFSLNEAGERVLHFHPSNPEEFMKKIENEQLKHINNIYKENGCILKVISLIEKEITKNRIENINIYY